MTTRIISSILVIAAGIVFCLAPAAAQEGGQAPAPRAKPGPAPRGADGKPDLQGMWNARAGTATQIIEDHEDGPLLRAGKTIVVDPPDGKIPYQPWALAERESRRRPEMNYHDPDTHCFLAGVPRVTYDMQPTTLIMQPPGHVVLLYEQPRNVYRAIPLDGRPHLTNSIRLWMGDSVGRWEGDTLVVETANNNGKNWLAQYGDFISADARVVERFSMVDADTIDYRATIEDPKVFTRPWTIGFPLGRSTETYLLETACVEDNIDPSHMRPASMMPTR